VVFGGSAGESREYTDPTAGGVVFGGSAGDVWTPHMPVPGPTCLTAGQMFVPDSYSGTVANGTSDWFYYDQVAGTSYVVTATVTSGGPITFTGYVGSCAGLVPVLGPTVITTTANYPYTAAVSRRVWAQANNTSGAPAGYTLSVN
jgi:hypothetical protein